MDDRIAYECRHHDGSATMHTRRRVDAVRAYCECLADDNIFDVGDSIGVIVRDPRDGTEIVYDVERLGRDDFAIEESEGE